MKKLIYSAILLWCVLLCNLQAQTIDFTDLRTAPGVPKLDSLYICTSNDTLSIEVSPSAAVTGATFSVNLPAGLLYDGVASTDPPGIIAGENAASTPELPVFDLNDFSGDFNIYVPVRANCQILALTSNSLPVNIEYELAHTGGSSSFIPNSEYNTQIFTPALNILSVDPDFPTLYGGETIDRTIVISQDGIAAKLESFTYQNFFRGGVIFNSVTVQGPTGSFIIDAASLVISNDSLTIDINGADLAAIGLGDTFDEGEEITIIENITATCDNQNSDFLASYGCDGEICEEVRRVNGFSIAIADPNIIATALSNPAIPDVCATSNDIEITLTNNGTEFSPGAGYANGLLVTIASGCAGVNSPPVLVDENSFQFNGTPITPTTVLDGVYTFDVAALTDAGATVGGLTDEDGDGFVDDLAIGEDLIISFSYDLACTGSTDCNSPGAFSCSGFDVFVDYSDHCDNIQPTANSNIAPILDYQAGLPVGIGEPDVVGTAPGLTFDMSFCYDYELSGVGCSNGATSVLRISHLSSDIIPVSATANGVAANVTVISPTEFEIDGGTVDGEINDCWDITVQYNGAACSSIEELFDFEVVYDCPCCTGTTTRACSSYETFIYDPGCGPDCDGIAITNFDISRTTFSYTDATMGALASEAGGARVDRALTCDDVAWTIDLEVYGSVPFPNADIAIAFEVPQDDITNNPFEFLDATISYNGNPTGCNLAVSGPVLSGTDVLYNFNLAACLSANGITLADGDQLQLVSNFNIADVPGIGGNFTFLYPRGDASATDAGGTVYDGCFDYGGENYYVANPEVTPSVVSMSQDGCGFYTVTGIIANNSGSGDDFPNEYRPYFGELSDIQFEVPVGYDFVTGSAQLEIIGDPGSPFALTPVISGDDETFQFSGTWPVPDKDIAGTQARFTFQLAPNCASSSGDVNFDITLNDEFLYAQPFEAACVSSNDYNITGSVNQSNPTILLNPLAPVRNAVDNTVSWELQVCNLGSGDYEQIWLSAENTSNQIQYAYLYDVTDSINNGGAKELITTTNAFGADNSIWSYLETAGNPMPFTPSECRFYELIVSYSNCSPDGVEVTVGGNCGSNLIDPDQGYTGTFGTYSCANQAAASLSFIPQEAGIQINLLTLPEDPIDLCADETYELEIKNTKTGTVYDPILEITLPTPGISFVSGSFEFAYPYDDATPATVADPVFVGSTAQGDVYRFNLNDISPNLDSNNGLQGVPVIDPADNRAFLRFDVETDCNYSSGGILRFAGSGNDPCGDPSTSILQSSLPYYIGGATPYTLIPNITSSSANFAACDANGASTITANIFNSGPDAVTNSTEDSIILILPADVIYDAGSSAIGEPTITTINTNQQRLAFELTSGIPANSTYSFNFGVDAPETYGCVDDIIVLETLFYKNVQCIDTGVFCDVKVPTSAIDTIGISFVKPQLTMTGSAVATCSGSNMNEQVDVVININNTGGVDKEDDTDIIFYEDDGNGVFDGTETVLETYTIDTISRGSNTYNHSFNVPVLTNDACSMHMVFLGGTECMCTPTDLIVDFPAIPYENAGLDADICQEGTTTLGCGDNVTGYLYSWTEPVAGALTSTVIANPDIVPEVLTNLATPNDPNAANVDYTFTLETNRGGCTTTDDVVVTVFPRLNGAETIYECQEEGVAQVIITLNDQGHTPPDGSGAIEWVWTPDLGTDAIGTELSCLECRNPVFTAASTEFGTYSYDLTYIDPNGCLATYRSTIEVTERPVIAAGTDSEICLPATSFQFSATASVGTGTWSQVSGPGPINFDDVNDPNATITGLQPNTCYTFRWTVVNGTDGNGDDICTVTDDLQICMMTDPDAGIDQNVCGTSTTLEGNTVNAATSEVGTWSQVSGATSVTFSPDVNTPTVTVTNMITSETGIPYVFRWTIENSVCTDFDDVSVTAFEAPIISAGEDQELCNVSSTTLTGTTSSSTGVWSITDDGEDLDVAIDAAGNVTNMDEGTCYTFTWTVDNGCVVTDDVQVCVIGGADAGTDQQICASSTQLSANTPVVGTGQWFNSSNSDASDAIFNPLDPNTGVANLQSGLTYEFVWVISNGSCDARDTVQVVIDNNPMNANAGNDQQLCDVATTTLTGSTDSGAGTWSISNNAGNGSLAVTPSGDVSGMIAGDCYTFLWTVTDNTCTATDEVQVCIDEQPTPVAAGADQEICATTTQLAATTPTTGTGVWTLTSGSGLTFNPNDPTTGVANLQAGQSYTFTWTVTNGVCSLSDDVVIDVNSDPLEVSAGNDQMLCNQSTATLAGTNNGGTGTWSISDDAGDGDVAIDNSGSVTNMDAGNCYTFLWTVANGVCTATDEVEVCIDELPTPVEAGADQNICATNTQLAATTPTTGTGVWTLTSGSG
ncbi:MAG: hypothetical protein ACPGVB_05290, partial [Chitinophagales bacterium]